MPLRSRPLPLILAPASALVLAGGAAPASAYVGPGAGLAVIGTAWTALVLALALATVALFPVYGLWTWICQRRRQRRARARRVVVIGLDGLDPALAERWMTAGHLPNLERLARDGSFCRLGTTLPAITPAAWSSFSTGVDPSRHGIFDFIGRDPLTYKPLLSSVDIAEPRRAAGAARWPWRRRRPLIRSRRHSRLFWHYLSRAGVFSSIIRVPITFPAEPFGGVLLSGMCVPDLRGTQGECTLFAANGATDLGSARGRVIAVDVVDGRCQSDLPGPAGLLGESGEVSAPLAVEVADGRATVTIGDQVVDLGCGEYSAWTEVRFDVGNQCIRGLCRFHLSATQPLSLYVTPLQIDPRRPLMPVSHPREYAPYLSRRLGPFGTLGLAEDTDAFDDGVLAAEAFLKQTWDLQREREDMLFHELDRNRNGLIACVFDGTDRVQHMFWRQLDAGRAEGPVADAYRRADELVGRVRAELEAEGDEAVLLVLSDHGFCDFRRGVDLNCWLREHGYLHTRDRGAAGGDGVGSGGDWLSAVDWSRTTAYAMGLSGIYLNQAGREAQGIVSPDGAPALRRKLAAELAGLRDPQGNEVAIGRVWDARQRFSGPYIDAAPDLFVGYNRGYRVSWSTARGAVGCRVFEDNDRRWSGDHSVDPDQVPGALWCSRPLTASDPHITELAPTILGLFGVAVPPHMRGRDLCAELAPPAETSR